MVLTHTDLPIHATVLLGHNTVKYILNAADDYRITISLQASITNLPKYEDLIDTTDTVDLEKIERARTEEHVFCWQEKIFSAWEIDHYKEVQNCISDVHLSYHNMLITTEYNPKKIFTYIHQDYYLPLPESKEESNASNKSTFNFHRLMKSFSFDERIGGIFGVSNSMHHLFRSDDNIALEHQQWMSMHIIFDDSLYAEDSQLLVKQECIMVSLYYNTMQNYLIVTPDVNDFATNPYRVVTQNGASNYQYGLEIILPESESDEELVSLLNKLYLKWEKKHNDLMNFAVPPPGGTKIYVAFEIVTARGFDANDVYIEFEIRIPESVKCVSPIRGRTHVAKALMIEEVPQWSYGQIIELEMEADDGVDSPPLRIFFEVISTDWWGRHRTEGYCYLPLPLSSGHYTEQLSCSRPEETNKMEADNRRFFVGGCHLIKDLEILMKPQLQGAHFTFTETGSVIVRWSTVRQPQAGRARPEPAASSSSSDLLQGAEAALRQYSKARARLAAATEDLADTDG